MKTRKCHGEEKTRRGSHWSCTVKRRTEENPLSPTVSPREGSGRKTDGEEGGHGSVCPGARRGSSDTTSFDVDPWTRPQSG